MSNFIKKTRISLKKWRKTAISGDCLTCDPRHFALATVGGLARKSAENYLILAETVAAAEFLRDEIGEWLRLLNVSLKVVVLPEMEGARHTINPERECERSRVFAMTENEGIVFVASVAAAFAPAPPPVTFRDAFLTLNVGMSNWAPHKLAEYLTSIDYDNEVEVRQPGEFSIRGGILDVFSPTYDFPVRLDFFGDELESIRTFSPDDQRSIETMDECLIIPRGEVAMRDLVEDEVASFIDYLDMVATDCILCSPLKLDCHLDTYCDADWSKRYAMFTEAWVPSLTLEETVPGSRQDEPMVVGLDDVVRKIRDLDDPELRCDALVETISFCLLVMVITTLEPSLTLSCLAILAPITTARVSSALSQRPPFSFLRNFWNMNESLVSRAGSMARKPAPSTPLPVATMAWPMTRRVTVLT